MPMTQGIISPGGPEMPRISGSPNWASAAQTVRSVDRARSQPEPSAWPRTAPITGLLSVHIARHMARQPERCQRQPATVWSHGSIAACLRSTPAQKARPAPRSTTTLTAGSLSALAKASTNSVFIVRLMAFSTRGRFIVMVQTRSRTA